MYKNILNFTIVAAISLYFALLHSQVVSGAAEETYFDDFDYGPFDYTDPIMVRDKLPVVEKYHFNSNVANLRGTMAGGTMGGHLLYVIRSFPNHHPALIAFGKLWQTKANLGSPPAGVPPTYTPDFVFRRALEFAQRDGTVRLLYAMYLLDTGRNTREAATLLEAASSLADNDTELHYNLGLMFLKIGDWEKAEFHATRAYEMGYPLPGLRRQLVAEGIWQE